MKRAVLFSTFLFAAVFALLQTEYCSPSPYPKLSRLELYVPDINGQNVISGFRPDGILYKVELPSDPPDTAVLLVEAQDATSSIDVTYDSLPVSLGPSGQAPLTLALDHSEIRVSLTAADRRAWTYTVSIDRVDYCPCDDANECTHDLCNANQVCEYPAVPNGSPCSEGRAECYVGVCGYFVSPSGDDGNPGTHEAPFRTINRAAQVAQPGDTITVQSGVYREWVRPARGGYTEDTRITYRTAPGADVRILGSEPATGWAQTSDDVWVIELDESRFAGFNPFNTLTRHPECVLTETGDCWGWLNYGRWTHLGDVYIDGVGLTEKQTMGEVEASPLSWSTETANETTTIWANFGERDPNEAAVELNHRPFAFFPEQVGLGYITVQGFVIQNVATHWAPPQVFQPGAIGPNGGHHWVIEDNIVMYAKAVCISIGNPNGPGDVGASGYHLIRNNVIMRCGQSGITGEWWTKSSQIVDNHIEQINYRHEFGGAETAGIKHHWGSKLHIEGNFIRSVTAGHGIWADFINHNWRLEGNLVLGAGVYAMMAEANDGPNLYANNIFVGGGIGVYSSRADAWAHNLFINAPQTWVNQDYGGRPPIRDARWANNVFIGDGLNSSIAPSGSHYTRNVFLDGAAPHSDDADAVIGNTPTDLEVLETSQGVALGFQVDEATLSAGYPLVDNETLELTFLIDATVDAGFFGEQRSELSNSPGPFATLQPGRNDFTIYEYPPLYLKASCYTGCDDSNDCTIDTCSPTIGCQHADVANGTACGGGFGACQDGSCTALTQLPCTEQGIRYAIAFGGGPHAFDCATPTTVVTTAEIIIDNDVVLDGGGNLTVDGNGDHRVFSVTAGVNAELIDLTVTGGSGSDVGGGILNAGTLSLTDVTISGNTAANIGGGLSIQPGATATLVRTTIEDNSVTNGSGGGVGNDGTMTLIDTTVRGNQVRWHGGGIFQNGSMALISSTVSGNSAGYGGAIWALGGSLVLTNSTVSSNVATEASGGAIVNEASMTMISTTIAANSAVGIGSAIWNLGAALSRDTIIAGDCGGTSALDSFGPSGGNIESPGDTCFAPYPGNVPSIPASDLNLGVLADNGGPTQTHKPGTGGFGTGSIAIDQIPEADCLDAGGAPLTTDQRGEPRPETGGAMCDIGSVEVQSGGTGLCEGVDCTTGEECMQDGTCNPLTGECIPGEPEPDGTVCNQGDGICQQGECVEPPP